MDKFNHFKQLIGLNDTDIRYLKAIHEPLKACVDQVYDRFYQQLMHSPYAREHLGNEREAKRLQRLQKHYFRQLTSGEYDREYFDSRLKVGEAHERFEIPPDLYVGAFGAYLALLEAEVHRILAGGAALQPTLTALHKVVLLDMTLALNAQYTASQEQVKQALDSALQDLALSETRFVHLLQGSSDPIALLNEDSHFIDCNPAALELFGFTEKAQLVGSTPVALSTQHQPGGEQSHDLAQRYIDQAWTRGYLRFEWRHVRVGGHTFPVEVTLTPAVFRRRNVLLVSWRDLTEVKSHQQRVERLAYFDELTTLSNRNCLIEQLSKMLAVEGQPVTLVYLDLLNLKEVNDTLGHEAGDQLLVEVSNRMRACARKEEGGLASLAELPEKLVCIARIAGDEFAIACGLGRAEAHRVVGVLERQLAEPFELEAGRVFVRARYGVAMNESVQDDAGSLLRNADIALQHAKESQSLLCTYDASLGSEMRERAECVRRLEQALKLGQGLELRFQPQVELRGGGLSGAEVLLRWYDEKLGWVPPSRFIPLAEERGLIESITRWVLSQTLRQRRDWQQKGYLVPERLQVKFAINVSARDLNDSHFEDTVLDMLKRNQLTPEGFELELTETGLMRDPETAIRVLHSLRAKGFTLAIDDFGTGHSSLNYLRDIQADLLKIDMSFVLNLLSQPANRAIVQTVIATAHIFGMKTLAEGVEDKATADELRSMGCDFAQGYYFEKPLTAEDFERHWLRPRKTLRSKPCARIR